MSIILQEPYRTRPIRWLERYATGDWRLTVYGITWLPVTTRTFRDPHRVPAARWQHPRDLKTTGRRDRAHHTA